jgi:hypothetical protein
MGIGLTLQELEGWRGQYDSMVRWHGRVIAAVNSDPSPDELDFLLAFFASCFHLRDWLRVTAAVDKKALEDLFLSKPELRVCRDLANGFKHHSLKDPSVDARFSVVNEYVPKNWPSAHALTMFPTITSGSIERRRWSLSDSTPSEFNDCFPGTRLNYVP